MSLLCAGIWSRSELWGVESDVGWVESWTMKPNNSIYAVCFVRWITARYKQLGVIASVGLRAP